MSPSHAYGYSVTGDFLQRRNVMSQLWIWFATAVNSLDVGVRIDPNGFW